jgi:hypothetical protein
MDRSAVSLKAFSNTFLNQIMKIEELQLELKNLINQPVIFTEILGNSITLYFDGQGREHTVNIMISSNWRYEKEGKVIMGSGDIPLESPWSTTTKEQFRQNIANLCSPLDDLHGAVLNNYRIDEVSLDITMIFVGEKIIRQFSSEAFD